MMAPRQFERKRNVVEVPSTTEINMMGERQTGTGVDGWKIETERHLFQIESGEIQRALPKTDLAVYL